MRERREAAEQIRARTARERTDYSSQLEAVQQQCRDNSAQLDEAHTTFVQIERELQAHQQRAAQAEEEYNSHRAELDQRQRGRMEHLRQGSEISRALERQQAERDALDERTVAMRGEEDTATTERDQALQAAGEAESALAETRQQLSTCQQQRATALAERDHTEKDLRDLSTQRDAAQRAAEANQARLQVLEKVRAGYQGYQSGVRTLMLESPHAALFRGVLGDLIEVETAYARAVEVALGEALQALIADSDSGLLKGIAHLRERSGRVGILSLEAPPRTLGPVLDPDPMPGLRGPLLDYVRPEASITPLIIGLLHNTFLVEDLQTALALTRRYPDAYVRCVTPDGDAVDLFGLASGGQSQAEDSGVLGRGREIRTLRSLVAHQKARYAAIGPRLAVLADQLGVLTQRLEDLATENETWRTKEREQIHQHQRACADAERLAARLAQLHGESTSLAKRCQALDQSIAEQAEHLRHNEAESTRLSEESSALEEDLKQSETRRRERREALGTLQVEHARTAEIVQGLERDATRLKNIDENLQNNIERLAAEGVEAERQQAECSARSTALAEELKGLHQGRETLAAEQDQRRQHWAAANTQNRELQENISHLQRQLNEQRERRTSLEVRISEMQLQTQHIRERVQEEYQCDVAAMGPLDEALDEETTQQRIDQLRQSLHRLGSVHLGVLEEHQEQKERYDFLRQQRDDLVIAAEDLKKTLSLIDRTARRMFLQSFEQIRETFKETFVRFFPGGEADLRLEENIDALEAQIDIIARPRGKRLQNIALLSGGERALT
ncbi:MAG: hypothetical protein F4Z30_03635, partial [Gemmatimonadetes bacterium]|nr:hypothetical protein [Gemmatimonadota bacterium]